jgi:ribosomal subunit interface protein
MLYNIKGTDLQITSANRSYVEKRLKTLDKFFGKKTGVRVDIELAHMKDEENKYRAEGTLHDHGFEGDFRVEAIGDSLHEAIDIMSNMLNLELARAKKRIISDKRKGALRFKDFIRGFTDKF